MLFPLPYSSYPSLSMYLIQSNRKTIQKTKCRSPWPVEVNQGTWTNDTQRAHVILHSLKSKEKTAAKTAFAWHKFQKKNRSKKERKKERTKPKFSWSLAWFLNIFLQIYFRQEMWETTIQYSQRTKYPLVCTRNHANHTQKQIFMDSPERHLPQKAKNTKQSRDTTHITRNMIIMLQAKNLDTTLK